MGKFIFEGYAKKIKQKGLAVWDDGIALSTDGIKPAAYVLQEGEKYRITVELLPSNFCSVKNYTE
jgi:hypothetical protein